MCVYWKMAKQRLYLSLVLMFLFFGSCSGFLFENDHCPYDKPCICSLSSINCQRRGITAIPKMVRPQVEAYSGMDVSENLITTLPAFAFKNLTVGGLVVGPNPITVFDDAAFVALNVSSLILATLPNMVKIPASVSQLSNLKRLYVYNTNITGLENSLMMGIGDTLEDLSIARTNIKVWPSSLQYATRLKKLHADGNLFTTIPDDAFDGFYRSLESVSLGNCGLTMVPKVPLNKLENLKLLDLSGNMLIQIPDDVFGIKLQNSLTALYISDTSLTGVPSAVRKLHNLEDLGLCPNPIKTLNMDSFSGLNQTLTILNMGHCQLNKIPPVIKTLHQLTTLYLTNTGLTHLEDDDFNGLSVLNTLELDRNKFTKISEHAFRGLPNVHSLSLFQCDLKEFPMALKDLTNLQQVTLYGNLLTRIPDYSFTGLRFLQILSMNNNPLTTIEDHAFDRAAVSVIDVSYGNLTTVPRAILSLEGFTGIDVRHNPVQCTCDLKWLLKRPYLETEGNCVNLEMTISKYRKSLLQRC